MPTVSYEPVACALEMAILDLRHFRQMMILGGL